MPQEINTAIATDSLTPPIQNFNITYDSPTRTGTQDIFNPIGTAGPQWISNAPKIKTSINAFLYKNSGRRPSFSKVVRFNVRGDPRVYVNSHGGMNFGSDSVVTSNPNFVNFGVASINATDKLGYVIVATTRVRRPTSRSYWRQQVHYIFLMSLKLWTKLNILSGKIFLSVNQLLTPPLFIWKIILPFHHIKMEKSNSLFHHRKMEKSISPFHYQKMQKGISPFYHRKLKKRISSFHQLTWF